MKDLLVNAGFHVDIVGLLEISVGGVADDLDLARLILAAHGAYGQRLAEGGSGVKHHPDGGGEERDLLRVRICCYHRKYLKEFGIQSMADKIAAYVMLEK